MASSAPRTDETVRPRIVAAAREQFFAHGFRRITMDDLAGELGMSKKTLYAQFPGKAALVKAVLLDKFERLDAELALITSRVSADFPHDLQRLLTCLHRHTEELRPPFLRDMQRDESKLFELVQEQRRTLIRRHFGILLKSGGRKGHLRKNLSVDLIVEILLGAVQAVMNPPKLTELGLTPTAGFTAIISVILNGVMNAGGRSKK